MLLLLWAHFATPHWQRTRLRNKKEEVDQLSRSSGWVTSVMSLMWDATAATKSALSHTCCQLGPAGSRLLMRCAHSYCFFFLKQYLTHTSTLGALFNNKCTLFWVRASAKCPKSTTDGSDHRKVSKKVTNIYSSRVSTILMYLYINIHFLATLYF